MSELNKSYRIRTKIGQDSEDYLTVPASITQDFDTFEVLSVSIKSSDTYRLHNADYGVVVGRVLGNNGFGIPNAKLSIFIEAENVDDIKKLALYPFASSISNDTYGIRYNLLPDNKLSDCHQVVGTFPNKRYLLDNDDLIEVYDKYYKYTTRTNNSGDYMICGVPTGQHTLHMDLDLSDCGILSQKPRDFVYKGYTIEQFENPNMFKGGHEFNSLSQVITQDQIINVNPFWGNDSIGETIGITRADINVAFKFEPTCVFMGCVTSDNASNGISRKCIPSESMGLMEEMTTGEGKIEMIRKTPGGSVEEFEIKGTQVINSDGVWCYQIPMNLDYLTTDEYGNMVPTDDPEKGIPTRTSVRFRLSMQDNEENQDNYHRAKVLIPHNPQLLPKGGYENYDYEFGSYTKDDSFRDLFWNNVYSVKSYIPRFQRRQIMGWKERGKFTGIKECNFFGQNNPVPYNNIRIRLPLMFMILCALIKAFIFVISLYNRTIKAIFNGLLSITNGLKGFPKLRFRILEFASRMRYMVLKEGLCPDLENWYFAPLGKNSTNKYQCVATSKDYLQNNAPNLPGYTTNCMYIEGGCSSCDNEQLKFTLNLLELSLEHSLEDGEYKDEHSIDDSNSDDEDATCITTKTDYLIACIEMALANEFKVIKFDFYNDWINGMIYIPRWVRYIKPKKRFLGITWSQEKTRGCMDNTKIFSRTRLYTQQCAIDYNKKKVDGVDIFHYTNNPLGNNPSDKRIRQNNRYHQGIGFKQYGIFGKKGGICHEATTLKKQHVYYLKPCEFNLGKKINLFATDLILLGSLNDCDENGIPMAFKHLSSTSYLMPPNIALTNMENNGPLYGKDGSVVCLGGVKQVSQTEVLEHGIGVADQTLTAEANYFSGGGYGVSHSQDIDDSNVDTIPITEQAGISWNYTGPGQGEINEKKMYYPGGHFLGLSCINSQSNIKSCINLSRICEVGANMSQRREDAREYDTNTGTLGFVYSVPSGFISGNDIVDTDFRSMFATLNSKRLIATRKNPYTGYKYYDFMFSRPINFDGSFQSIVYMGGSEYNTGTNRGSRDESDALHNQYQAAYGYENDDYDPNEYENTQTKTKESPNLYYYMFRFGLSDVDQISLIQKNKFLYHETDKKFYLPQYENSYYFYFGLKQGSSAIDEFNKQFFSQCETMTLEKEASVFITTTFSACTNKGDITVITNNMEMPYHSIVLTKDGEEYEIENIEDLFYNETFTIENLPYGNYEITIIDDNFVTISRQFTIGGDFVVFNDYITNFTVNLVDNELPSLYAVEEIYRGGFVDISDISIDGMDISEFVGNAVTFRLINEEDPTDCCNCTVDDFSGSYRLFGKKTGVYYKLMCLYQCDGFEPVEIEIKRFQFTDNSRIKLKIGDPEGVNYNCIIGENGSLRSYMKKMYTDWWWDSNHQFNIAESTKEKWNYRRFFFKESKSTNDTFNSHVYAENGDKVIWGSPQNKYTILSASACSEYYLTIPHGYSLDDTHTNIPTFGVSPDSSVQTASTNTQIDRGGGDRPIQYSNLQYSAIACNGEEVCGNYFITYDKNRTPRLENISSSKYFKNGYGCVFKPMPNGELLYMFYNDSDDFYDMIHEIETKRSDVEYGIIYPTFIYPVMKRPFYANFDMFLWSESKIGEIEGEYVYYTQEGGIKTEGNIHNGITYNQIFDNSSWVGGFDQIEFVNEINNINSDLSGLTYLSPQDRIIEINRYKDIDEFTHDEIGYEIKQGRPEDVASENLSKISYRFDGSFADTFYVNRNLETNTITGFGTVGGDDDIYYCLMKYGPQDNISFIEESEESKYIIDHNQSTVLYRVLCEYSNNGSSLALHETEYGKYAIVKIVFDGGASHFKIVFEYKGEDGIQREYNESHNFIQGDNSSHIENIIDKIGVIEGGECYGLPLKGLKNFAVKESPIIENQPKKWKEVINKLRNPRHLFTENYFRTKELSFDEDTETLFGLGFVEESSANGGRTSIYKIYPNIYSNYGQFVSWGDGLGKLWINQTSYSCDAATHTLELTISASSPTTVTITKDGWIDCNPPILHIHDEIEYHITINIQHNNETTSRNCSVKFKSSSNNEKSCNISQNGASGMKTLRFYVSPINEYGQGYLEEVTREVYAQLLGSQSNDYVQFDVDITYEWFDDEFVEETWTHTVNDVTIGNSIGFVDSHFGLGCDVVRTYGNHQIIPTIKNSNLTNVIRLDIIRRNI